MPSYGPVGTAVGKLGYSPKLQQNQWLISKNGGEGSHQRTRLCCLFPVKREDTGKFVDFGFEMTKAPRLSGGNSIVCEPNSLAAKAGKICRRTGNPKAHNSERAARLLHVNRR